MDQPKAKKPKPIPLTMVICDAVIDDKKTGKKSLIGLFNNISSGKMPCVHPRLNVFITMTEGYGNYDGVLRCVPSESGKQVMEMKGPLVFRDPHQVVELDFEINNIRFDQYGEYRFEFLCGGELLISRKFKVSQIAKKEETPKNEGGTL
ncbi:MAG: hypothetical protein PHW14_04330 [Candidatus Omnitrophica bacterium]|nr:hypothetical protein [Candidatus Omnitrophota bacterium]